ncbi:MAG: NAD(P)/FAD-dependent oxidoreductase [Dehalococcoidia bacterium]
MSHLHYDVIVVGAGPAGSYAAYKLASSGHRVAVFEEKSAPGVDSCCTGIISPECLESLDLRTDVTLTRADSARFFAPSGRCLRFQAQKVQAYVADRGLLDRALAAKAQSRGAQYFFSSPIRSVVPGKDGIQAEARCSGTSEVFTARALVLASGCTTELPQRLGLGKVKRFLIGAQTELETRDITEVEVHFGRRVAPGSFAWLVPVSNNRAYAGLLSSSDSGLLMQRFVDDLCRRGRATNGHVKIRQKAIPLETPARSYGDRVLAIGDAAGQVKRTTGGGIYFGHLGARIAAGVLDAALKSDDLTMRRLAAYQKQWKAKIGKELRRGQLARWALTRLSDAQIERVFDVLGSNGHVQHMIESGDISFDWHSKLALAALRYSSAYPWLRMRRLLSREGGS